MEGEGDGADSERDNVDSERDRVDSERDVADSEGDRLKSKESGDVQALIYLRQTWLLYMGWLAPGQSRRRLSLPRHRGCVTAM